MRFPLSRMTILTIVLIILYLIPMGCGLLHDLRVNNRFQPTSCMVLNKKLEFVSDNLLGSGYRATFQVFYQVGDTSYEAWEPYSVNDPLQVKIIAQKEMDSVPIGSIFHCWFDPIQPNTLVLKQDHNILLWVCTVFFISLSISIGLLADFNRKYGRDVVLNHLSIRLFFLLMASALLISSYYLLVNDWKTNHRFQKTECTVIRMRTDTTQFTATPYLYASYKVGDQTYKAWSEIKLDNYNGILDPEKVARHYKVGNDYPCWYYPADPNYVVFELLSYSLSGLVVLIFGIVLLVWMMVPFK